MYGVAVQRGLEQNAMGSMTASYPSACVFQTLLAAMLSTHLLAGVVNTVHAHTSMCSCVPSDDNSLRTLVTMYPATGIDPRATANVCVGRKGHAGLGGGGDEPEGDQAAGYRAKENARPAGRLGDRRRASSLQREVLRGYKRDRR